MAVSVSNIKRNTPNKADETRSRMDAAAIESLYAQMRETEEASIDGSVASAVAQLEQAQADAQKDFDARQAQVDLDEAQARDRQVLYAAARGDRGGITARQYDSISNTASKGRQTIEQQRQALATETNRQIADLRAQGEFRKADALLQLTQQQLSQLWELQQYEDNQQLQAEKLAMQQADLTGMYNGEKTYDAARAEQEWDYTTQQQAQKQAYQVAMEMIRAGQMPSDSLLQSAGMLAEKTTYQNMANLYKTQLTAKTTSSGSSSKSSGSSATSETSLFEQMVKLGISDYENAYAYLSGHKSNFTDKQVANNAEGYMNWLRKQNGQMEILENVDGQLVSSDVVQAYVRLGMIRVVTENGRTQYHWAENVAQ
ncbi:MAG: hypothetical protein IKU27_03955 [Clostridia bacterium]|nr:hypothetical protein [Clostridia bacterium]